MLIVTCPILYNTVQTVQYIKIKVQNRQYTTGTRQVIFQFQNFSEICIFNISGQSPSSGSSTHLYYIQLQAIVVYCTLVVTWCIVLQINVHNGSPAVLYCSVLYIDFTWCIGLQCSVYFVYCTQLSPGVLYCSVLHNVHSWFMVYWTVVQCI